MKSRLLLLSLAACAAVAALAQTFPAVDFVSVSANSTTGQLRAPTNFFSNTTNAGAMANAVAGGTATVAGRGLLTVAGTTGTGNAVLANSPTLVTPVLGAATATSLALGSGGAVAGALVLNSASDSVPSLGFGSINFGWGLLERLTEGDLLLNRRVSGSASNVVRFSRASGDATFFGNLTVSGGVARFQDVSNTYATTLTTTATKTLLETQFGGSSLGIRVNASGTDNLLITSTGVTAGGNLTVNGTGTSSFGGPITAEGISAVGTTSNRFFVVSANAGQVRGLNFQTAGSTRWLVYANTSAEAGSNAGSDFAIGRYNDAGSNIDQPFTIARSTGVVDMAKGAKFQGTTTNDNAATGYVGEYVSSTVTSGSAVSLTTGTAANVTSISLTAGDWDVSGVLAMDAASATVTTAQGGPSSTSATLPSFGSYVSTNWNITTSTQTEAQTLPRVRFALSSTTTVYLVARAYFSAGTVAAYGQITARRVR